MGKIEYEWTCEIVEAHECVDAVHFDEFRELVGWMVTNPPATGYRHEVALVRHRDEEPMLWAYVVDGKLPACFGDGCDGVTTIKVPQRFRREFDNLSGFLPN